MPQLKTPLKHHFMEKDFQTQCFFVKNGNKTVKPIFNRFNGDRDRYLESV